MTIFEIFGKIGLVPWLFPIFADFAKDAEYAELGKAGYSRKFISPSLGSVYLQFSDFWKFVKLLKKLAAENAEFEDFMKFLKILLANFEMGLVILVFRKWERLGVIMASKSMVYRKGQEYKIK